MNEQEIRQKASKFILSSQVLTIPDVELIMNLIVALTWSRKSAEFARKQIEEIIKFTNAELFLG